MKVSIVRANYLEHKTKRTCPDLTVPGSDMPCHMHVTAESTSARTLPSFIDIDFGGEFCLGDWCIGGSVQI
jgi:hypothetical protein